MTEPAYLWLRFKCGHLCRIGQFGALHWLERARSTLCPGCEANVTPEPDYRVGCVPGTADLTLLVDEQPSTG